MTVTRTKTSVAVHGSFTHDTDLLAEQMTRTRADLLAEVKTRLEGDGITGLSKLRKHELAAMLADWATATRDNERAARAVRANREALPTSTRVQRAGDKALRTIQDQALGRVLRPSFDLNSNGSFDCPPPVHADRSASAKHTVPFIAHDLANSETGEIWTVAGTREILGDWQRTVWYGDDERGFSVLAPADLNHWATKAVCGHGYTANDSCPGCDADYDELIRSVELYGTQVSEHIGQPVGQPSIELGMIYQHADCTWSAVSPTGVVLGSNIVSSDSAVRALRLDHKVRVWRTALNDNVLHDARKLDEQAALSVDSNRQRVEDAVALLRACGITTGAQFERRLAALTEE